MFNTSPASGSIGQAGRAASCGIKYEKAGTRPQCKEVLKQRRFLAVFVAASTASFPHLTLHAALDRIVDLEFTNVEIDIVESGPHLKPSEVMENMEAAINRCRGTHRLSPAAYWVEPAPGPTYYEHFAACARLAKATKVVTLAVRSAELGTPFNEEVDRLRRLVALALVEGTRVALKIEKDRISQDVDTMRMLCDNVKGLGVTLDPSHLMTGVNATRGIDSILQHVFHVHLRDSTKTELQVKIGQGEIEYGRLIGQLEQVKYDRALCVDVLPMDDVDHEGELRKLRLILDSWL